MLFDAHTHLSPGACQTPAPYYQLATASTPEECRFLWEARQRDDTLFYACGVHPWQSDQIHLGQLQPWFQDCAAIGEIGMDRTWCAVGLGLQRRVFQQQLDLAQELRKPVVLHTKGCEPEVLAEIKAFPLPVLVHWYSSLADLEAYIDLGCYCSVGPDLKSNSAVGRLAALVPLNRLTVETDGVGGASWALGRAVTSQALPAVLQDSIAEIARIRGCSPAQIEQAAFENMMAFLGK